VLGGKYRLEREIGRGSMGTVWSAVHLTLGQRVAIKLIAAEHAQAVEARKRFSTEAKAAARLRSRYVVQVYDDGETPSGTPYIVLEYLDGETLEQRLDRDRDVPLNDAVRITRHVARALSRAHAAGIVHRDLKPGNVFLARTEDDEVGWVAKVLDFGIAKLEEHGIASTTKTGTLLGTPLFMSPEQVRGASSVDGRSDLYSLGMVFYNMLTGGFAFNGQSFADVLVAICTAPLVDIRAHAPWVPESVAEWFQKACARDVQQRFQSADEMIEALDLALGVSTGAYSRQSAPEVKVDTLRGHAPPVAHTLPRVTPSDSGEFANGATQVMVTDQAVLKISHTNTVLGPDAAPGAADVARSFDSELMTVPTSSRAPWLIAGVLLLLGLLAAAALLFRSNASTPPTADTNPPSSASASSIPPTPPVATDAPVPVPVPVPVPDPPPSTDPTAPPSAAQPPPSAANGARPAPARPAGPVATPTPKNPPKTVPEPAPPAPEIPRNTSTDMGF